MKRITDSGSLSQTKLTSEQIKTLEEIVEECKTPYFSTINVASKKRREAIIAIDQLLREARVRFEPVVVSEEGLPEVCEIDGNYLFFRKK